MKRVVGVVVTLITLVSCTSEISEQAVPIDASSSPMLKRLQAINDSMASQQLGTRGAWGKLKRVYSADGAAFNAAFHEMDNKKGSSGSPSPYALYQGLVSGARASKKAYYGYAYPEIPCLVYNDSLYDEAYTYCKSHYTILKDNIALDDLLSDVQIPVGYRYLGLVGFVHNDIVRMDLNLDQELSIPTYDNAISAYEAEGRKETQRVISIYSSAVFSSSCKQFARRIDKRFSQGELNCEQLFQDVANGSSLYAGASILFHRSLDYCYTMSDLKTVVNSYISAIETYNELTSDEKAAVYGGFFVTIYSYQLWTKYFKKENGDPSISLNPQNRKQ